MDMFKNTEKTVQGDLKVKVQYLQQLYGLVLNT